ncbi:hypothetical protein E1B28_005963 [Marasmius oreades]|uniref:HMG box domain-containing protein n=1 Tax=Marasmius oreades TaxID=181124 RepID=A0A9P7S4W8_9AGAR|nr:uncharacterized protein E1B28_005963 [Marasmius oreades]KAG7095185.1 hypothetical protein E1B28_005963 [Marasmius oreades]
MFASLRLGLAARLIRSPLSFALLRVGPLGTPITLARRTFLTSVHVNNLAGSKAAEKTGKKDKKLTKKPARQSAVAKKTKKSTKRAVAKKKPVKSKPKQEEGPKIDKKLLKPPKRPASAYVKWHAEHVRHNVKPKSLHELAAATREIAAIWHELPGDVKEGYQRRRKEEFSAWQKEYERWYNGLTREQLKAAEKLNKKKRTFSLHRPAEQPKRPPTSYIQFYMDFMRDHPGPLKFELSKEAAKAWKALPEPTRDEYKQRYARALEQHHKNLETYKRQFPSNAGAV